MRITKNENADLHMVLFEKKAYLNNSSKYFHQKVQQMNILIV